LTEAVLQILLILAYLTIGLLSVTFPIYALCVTYLKQEKYSAERERKRSVKEAKDEIIKLTNEMSAETTSSKRFRELQEKTSHWKQELERLEQRPYLLSARGAVLVPTLSFFGSLALACLGIYAYYEGSELQVYVFAVGSLVFSCFAIAELYQTIRAVELATLKVVETELISVFQKTGTPTQEVKAGQASVIIGCHPADMDLEKAAFYIYFPPEIEVKTHTGNGMALQPEYARFPKYTMVRLDVEYATKHLFQPVKVEITANQVGEYKIPVILIAKGIEESISELTLEVIP
jgi:hypothetical protein